jgi:hypothetical protein
MADRLLRVRFSTAFPSPDRFCQVTDEQLIDSRLVRPSWLRETTDPLSQKTVVFRFGLVDSTNLGAENIVPANLGCGSLLTVWSPLFNTLTVALHCAFLSTFEITEVKNETHLSA